MGNLYSSSPEVENQEKVPVVLSEEGRRRKAEQAKQWAEEKKRAADVRLENESLKQQAEFPIDALGKTLAEAARAIATIIQCPLSTAAGVVLAHAAAAAQGALISVQHVSATDGL